MQFLQEMKKLLTYLNNITNMKKTTLLLLTFLGFVGFAQQKSTGVMSLNNGVPITANFTLNNSTSQVTLILTGPADRWFGLGIGIQQGFGMQNGDVVIFTTNTTPNLTDRNFIGTQQPSQDAAQSWTTVSNLVSGTVRTLTLTRALTNTDSGANAGQDKQFPYATTNSISIGGVRAGSANMNIGSHGGSASAGFATANFTTLSVEDFSLNASTVFPNPSSGNFTVKTKTGLDKIEIYSQTGTFVKSIDVKATTETEVNIEGLSTGIYLIQLQNSTEKTWKKVLVN